MTGSQTCWTSPIVQAADSAIDGRGLVVREAVVAGTLLVRLGGLLVSDAELRQLIADASASGGYVDSIGVDIDRHLVLRGESLARLGNHSCDPSMWLDGPHSLVARRDVHAGEELTCDYGTLSTLPEFSMRCNCDSPLCRGRVTGCDWRRPELQRRYGERWIPAALRLMRP